MLHKKSKKIILPLDFSQQVYYFNSSQRCRGGVSKKFLEEFIMKKFMLFAVAALIVYAVSGCGSLRTPKNGDRSKYVYYNTFFGLSIESGVYGDGFIVK